MPQDVLAVVTQEIVAHCSLSLDSEAVKIDSWLVEFGFDSVNSVDLIMSLEEQFDIEIEDEDAVSIQTVQDLVVLIEAYLRPLTSAV